MATHTSSKSIHGKKHHLSRQTDTKTGNTIISNSSIRSIHSTGTSSTQEGFTDKEQMIALEIIGISVAFTIVIVCGLIVWIVYLNYRRKKR